LSSRTVRRPRHLALSLVLAASTLAIGVGQAAAVPNDLASLTDRLEKQNAEADIIVDEYNAKQEQLDATQRQLAGLKTKVAQARARHSLLQAQVDGIGVATYMKGPGAGIAAVLDGDPARAIQGIEVLDVIAQRNEELMVQYRTIGQTLETSSAELAQTEKSLAAQLAELKTKKDKVEKVVANTEHLVAELRARERAARVQRTSGQEYGPRPGPGDVKIPPVGGGAGAAIAFARAQLGKPYRYGATGPDSYDCSGLVGAAWRAGGKALPRTSGALRASLPVVSNPQPGDIAWTPGHVALVVDSGHHIAATHTGDVVRYQPLRSNAIFLRP
jgi:cell wall-associated NlpC family hydrolase